MITTLSQASALNPGAELWVTTDLEKSKWTAKIDWYLNFQIVKASRHQPPPLSEFLIKIIEKTNVEVQKMKPVTSASLLIYSQALLPNKWVAVVSYHDNLKEWMKNIYQVREQLQNPSLRIFLPAGQLTTTITEQLLTTDDEKEMTVVLDLLN